MKKILFIPVICAIFVSCNNDSKNRFADANASNETSTQSSDWEITANIKKMLMMDSSLSSSARMVSVTTNNGIVTLSGNVSNKEERRKVYAMVKGVAGVRKIDNQLAIQSEDAQPPSDWQITANVKETIMNDSSLSEDARVISVTTNNGVVTLTGTVVSREEKRKVAKMVRDIPGVKSVDNQLIISGS